MTNITTPSGKSNGLLIPIAEAPPAPLDLSSIRISDGTGEGKSSASPEKIWFITDGKPGSLKKTVRADWTATDPQEVRTMLDAAETLAAKRAEALDSGTAPEDLQSLVIVYDESAQVCGSVGVRAQLQRILRKGRRASIAVTSDSEAIQ